MWCCCDAVTCVSCGCDSFAKVIQIREIGF